MYSDIRDDTIVEIHIPSYGQHLILRFHPLSPRTQPPPRGGPREQADPEYRLFDSDTRLVGTDLHCERPMRLFFNEKCQTG